MAHFSRVEALNYSEDAAFGNELLLYTLEGAACAFGCNVAVFNHCRA